MNKATAGYPLSRNYYRRALPLLLACAALLVGGAAFGGRYLAMQMYLETANRQAQVMLNTTARVAPEAFAQWIGEFSSTRRDAATRPGTSGLRQALDAAAADRALPKLKIYDMQGVIRYSTAPEEIGTIERSAGLDQALREQHNLALEIERGGTSQYELYAYLPPASARPAMVVELYEPKAWLSDAVGRLLWPATLAPLVLLLGLMALLQRMVSRTQRDIDQRSEKVSDLQARLERLVSQRAVSAAHQPAGVPAEGHLVDATVYFADVRDFTSYAESHRPAEVVTLLNRLITLQVEVIDLFKGDVDKIIGDAVLAVFLGDDRAERAVACAQEVLHRCAGLHDLPRGLALGLHDGFMVAGYIGTPQRQDYTVIGDAVNLAQRLCSLAARGELVSDVNTLSRAGHPGDFGDVEEVMTKGRSEPVRIRRWGVRPA